MQINIHINTNLKILFASEDIPDNKYLQYCKVTSKKFAVILYIKKNNTKKPKF